MTKIVTVQLLEVCFFQTLNYYFYDDLFGGICLAD